MKKLLYIFLTVLIVACSSDDGNTDVGDNSGGDNSGDVDNPCLYNPTLTTSAVTNVTETSATLNGVISIVSENCEEPTNTEQGFVYATTIQPTIANTQVNVDGTNISINLEGLTPNTTYYVRTFLTNTLGEFYGNEVSFITEEEITVLLNCDGNPVPTIVYGTQEWTVEDFCMETFRDGTPIPQVQDNSEWGQGQSPKWAYYDNDPTQLKVYNYEAVRNGLFAPEGWHVPTAEEWTILEEYLIANGYNYDNTTTGNKIGKSMASTTGWYEGEATTGNVGYNQSINNSSGFNGIPTPYRKPNGGWCCAVGDGTNAVKVWWTNGPWNNEAQVPYRLLDTNQPHIQNDDHQLPAFGFSVRLVKD